MCVARFSNAEFSPHFFSFATDINTLDISARNLRRLNQPDTNRTVVDSHFGFARNIGFPAHAILIITYTDFAVLLIVLPLSFLIEEEISSTVK